MSDIDLIPNDYRFGLWLRRNGLRFIWSVAVLLVVSAFGYGALERTIDVVRTEIGSLQRKEAVTTEQRRQTNSLNERKQWAESQLRLLEGLRGGVSAQSMFLAVDRALTDDSVWFTRWEFQRAGSFVEHPDKAVESGYFVILPKQNDSTATEAWKIETHMSIEGEARDFAALSGFVSRLLNQPEIQRVHVRNTSTRVHADRRSVAFTLAVIVNTAAGHV